MSFTFNPSQLNKLDKAITKSLVETAHYVESEVVEAQVVPMDLGTLQESSDIDTTNLSKGEVDLVYNEPYARRLYFHPEYHFSTENNPNAKGKWLEDWTEKGKYAKDVKKAYGYFLKKNGGL